mmetsp:Transcript_23607/g.26920  ORF Transcript_23607/g.26920 Transcript_23607/m.26920 type:complete len:537 (+) Transcript_23607:212-1822(+)
MTSENIGYPLDEGDTTSPPMEYIFTGRSIVAAESPEDSVDDSSTGTSTPGTRNGNEICSHAILSTKSKSASVLVPAALTIMKRRERNGSSRSVSSRHSSSSRRSRRELSASHLDHSGHHSWANRSGYSDVVFGREHTGATTSSTKSQTCESNYTNFEQTMDSKNNLLYKHSPYTLSRRPENPCQDDAENIRNHSSGDDAGLPFDQFLTLEQQRRFSHTSGRGLMMPNTSTSSQKVESKERLTKSAATTTTTDRQFSNQPRRISHLSDPGCMLTKDFDNLCVGDNNFDRKSVTGVANNIPTKSVLVRQRRSSIVSFSTIEIRQYERILGDNPSCSCGPSISIGWEYDETSTSIQPIDDYEFRRGNRFDDTEMVLSRHERELLLFDLGYSKKEVVEAIRLNLKLKKRRRQTVNNLPIAKVEELIEGASKKISRVVRKRPRSKHLYNSWLHSGEDGRSNSGAESSSSQCTVNSSLKRSSHTSRCSDVLSSKHTSQEKIELSSSLSTSHHQYSGGNLSLASKEFETRSVDTPTKFSNCKQ